MQNIKDAIALAVTIAVQFYVFLLAGRYFGFSEVTLFVWAGVVVLGILLTDRYYAWSRRT